MRVIVTGGRCMKDKAFVYRTLTRLHEAKTISVVVHGGAKGADSWANVWADDHGVKACVFRPDWKRFGRGGGAARNEEMAAAGADMCVAFPGGNGTNDMIARARKHNIPVVMMTYDDSERRSGAVFRWHDTLESEVIFVTLKEWEGSDAETSKVSILILRSTYVYFTSGEVLTLRNNDRLWLDSVQIT